MNQQSQSLQPQQQKQRKISQKKTRKQINQVNNNTPQPQQNKPIQIQQPRPQQQQQQQQPPPPQRIKQKKQSISQKSNRVVNFNLKKNFVEKFYCPEMAIANLTKSDPIDLGSIQDLPEIPLDSLFGTL